MPLIGHSGCAETWSKFIWIPDFWYMPGIWSEYAWYIPCIWRCPTYTWYIHGISKDIPCISIRLYIHGISLDTPNFMFQPALLLLLFQALASFCGHMFSQSLLVLDQCSLSQHTVFIPELLIVCSKQEICICINEQNNSWSHRSVASRHIVSYTESYRNLQQSYQTLQQIYRTWKFKLECSMSALVWSSIHWNWTYPTLKTFLLFLIIGVSRE